MASGKSLELAKIHRAAPVTLTTTSTGVFGTDGPTRPHARADLAWERQKARVRDRIRASAAWIAWARAHGFDELGRPL